MPIQKKLKKIASEIIRVDETFYKAVFFNKLGSGYMFSFKEYNKEEEIKEENLGYRLFQIYEDGKVNAFNPEYKESEKIKSKIERILLE